MDTNTERFLYKEVDRFLTFQNWDSFMDKTILAMTGFYYTGIRDIVKCYFCRVEIGEWEPGDNAIAEHKRWFTFCPLLCSQLTTNEPINQTQLTEILEQNLRFRPAFLNLNHGIFDLKDYTVEANRIKSFEKGWPLSSTNQSPELLSDAGFYYLGIDDKVECFSCGGGLKDWEPEDIPWEIHALCYPKCRYVNLMKGEKYVSTINKNYTNSVQTSPTKDDKNIDKNIVETNLCKICLVEKFNTVIVPCMHVVACVKCSFSLKSCPICRSTIQEIQKIYFS